MVKTATLYQATADWGRAEKLHEAKGVAQAEYDSYKANFMAATANLELSKANVGLQQANLKTAQTNLDYATISAPVSGVVVDRRVNVGQTVVASLSAPSLFLIAKDLTKMEVWATVNEVDVGKIVAGQDVKFTVDAFPGRVYHGKVVPQGKLPFRLNATMNQNVVTYTVVVSVDNEDRKLSPYLTANLTFIVADLKDVLLVPNAALRWQPAREQIAPDQRDSLLPAQRQKTLAHRPRIPGPGLCLGQGRRRLRALHPAESRLERQPQHGGQRRGERRAARRVHTSSWAKAGRQQATPAAPILSSHRHSRKNNSKKCSVFSVQCSVKNGVFT